MQRRRDAINATKTTKKCKPLHYNCTTLKWGKVCFVASCKFWNKKLPNVFVSSFGLSISELLKSTSYFPWKFWHSDTNLKFFSNLYFIIYDFTFIFEFLSFWNQALFIFFACVFYFDRCTTICLPGVWGIVIQVDNYKLSDSAVLRVLLQLLDKLWRFILEKKGCVLIMRHFLSTMRKAWHTFNVVSLQLIAARYKRSRWWFLNFVIAIRLWNCIVSTIKSIGICKTIRLRYTKTQQLIWGNCEMAILHNKIARPTQKQAVISYPLAFVFIRKVLVYFKDCFLRLLSWIKTVICKIHSDCHYKVQNNTVLYKCSKLSF